MEIHISEKVHQFCAAKGISQLYFVVHLTEEPCTQIYQPMIKTNVKISNPDTFELVGKFDEYEIYQDSEYLQMFGNIEEIQLDLKGLLKKQIIIKNVDPIIRNVCKVPQ